MAIDPMAGMENMDPEFLRRLRMQQEAEAAQVGLAGTGLGTQAIEAEGEAAPIEGPTAEVPFRFTQQELNPRGEAVSGQMGRDPRARSAFGLPMAQSQAALPIMYQSQLPMQDRAIAIGKTDAYKDLAGYSDIVNPNSLRGRASIAGLEGFEGPTQNTLMFDMDLIGKGMGFSDSKIQRMLSYKPRGTKEVEVFDREGNVTGTRLVHQGPGKNTEAFGKSFGDEEQFFMGLAQMSGKPGGKAGRMEGEKNYRGAEGVDYGNQKDLDFKLDDPRHMAEIAKIGERYAMGRGGNIGGDEKESLFRTQRGYDRQFRDAGRVSGSIWEDKSTLVKMGMMAAMAAVSGGALGPLLAGALAPTLGLAGATAGSVAGGLGGSLLTGASMGLTGGAMGGLLQSISSGFEGGLGGTLKNIGMGAGIGGLSGGVLGGLSHAGSLAFGGQGFQGLQGAQTGVTGAGTEAESFVQAGLSADELVKSGYIQSGVGTQGGAAYGVMPSLGQGQMANIVPISQSSFRNISPTGAGALWGAQGGATGGSTPDRGVFDRIKDVARGPAGKIAMQTGQGAMEAHQRGTMATEAALQAGEAQGARASAQAQTMRSGLRAQREGIFGTRLPDSPFYDPIEDILSAQEGAL